MRLLSLDDLLHIAQRAIGTVEVRDIGLLESAAARPATTLFGDEAYPRLHDKAAALVHSVARNRALVDGDKRLAFASLFAFLGLNGERIVLSDDDAYQLIIDIASGELDDVATISARLDVATASVTFDGGPE